MPLTDIIACSSASQDAVADAGLKLLVMLYGGQYTDNLNSLRHTKYMEKARLSTILSEKLPPTERAAYYHCLRVHFQVVVWTTLGSKDIEPTKWGWKSEGGWLTPIATDLEPVPNDLIKVIRCNCKSSVANQCLTNLCTCRIIACGHCHGNSRVGMHIHQLLKMKMMKLCLQRKCTVLKMMNLCGNMKRLLFSMPYGKFMCVRWPSVVMDGCCRAVHQWGPSSTGIWTSLVVQLYNNTLVGTLAVR